MVCQLFYWHFALQAQPHKTLEAWKCRRGYGLLQNENLPRKLSNNPVDL